MNKSDNQFEEIYKELCKLKFSHLNVAEVVYLANRAKALAKAQNPDRRKNPCLNNIVQTLEKQIEPLIQKDIPEDEREQLFKEALSNLKMDIHMYCRKLKK